MRIGRSTPEADKEDMAQLTGTDTRD